MQNSTTSWLLTAILSAALVPVIATDVARPAIEPNTRDILPSETAWFVTAAGLPAYATATAHDPHFAAPGLWGDDVNATLYAKHIWPKGRVLVWAKPGIGAKDGWDAKYWLEDGKPATKGIDVDSDLVFPEGGTRYSVNLTDGRKYQPSAFRHLTIGKLATVAGHFSMRGNLWIKPEGNVMFLDSAVGGGHTFWRNDNLTNGWGQRGLGLVDHFHFSKTADGSVEFIGIYSSDDNWQFHSGLFIVATGSEIGMGNRTPPKIEKDATVAIMSGGYLTRRSNCDWGTDLTVEGKLLAGLPERPLTRDARLGLGWKSKGVFLGSNGGGRMPGPKDMGMVVAESGSVTVHTSNAAKARLVINCSRRDDDWGQIEIISRGHPLHGDPLIAKLKELPRRTDVEIRGSITWPGILFDDIRAGGIQIATPPDLSGSGKGPTFGTGIDGKPAGLFAPLAQ
jgi:hypothetical protein